MNYTTYDIWCSQDSMNPYTHCDVMVLSSKTEDDAHIYWYACILGVFHAQVLHTGATAKNCSIQAIEFLWVQWFGLEPNYRSGTSAAHLPKIGFVPDTDDNAFDFLGLFSVLQSPTYSGRTPWTPESPGGFRWNVEELQIKEYESGNSRNSGWILGEFQA
jgi:hypothetical protein